MTNDNLSLADWEGWGANVNGPDSPQKGADTDSAGMSEAFEGWWVYLRDGVKSYFDGTPGAVTRGASEPPKSSGGGVSGAKVLGLLALAGGAYFLLRR